MIADFNIFSCIFSLENWFLNLLVSSEFHSAEAKSRKRQRVAEAPKVDRRKMQISHLQHETKAEESRETASLKI